MSERGRGYSNVSPFEINPDDLEPAIDIDLKMQKKILHLCAILDSADHYTLLGVSQDAEKKEIRTAYFERMNQFHADKFYRKNVGRFGPRLQKIVQTLTKASDVLSRKKSRSEYDDYLKSRQTTLGARVSVAPRPPTSRPPEESQAVRAVREAVAPIDIVAQIPRAPRTPQLANNEGNKQPQGPTSHADRLGTGSSIPPASPRSNDAARRLLARKMGRRASPKVDRASVPPPSPDPTQVRQAVDADLRKRYDARKNSGRVHVEKYTALAESAVLQRDWASAVNSMKMAAEAAPDDAQLQARRTEIQEMADSALAPKFLEQAKYEEKDGRYERAARSYERAARGKNSAELFEKAALCLLRLGRLSEEDKRRLVELARKSVTLDNRDADYRLTLARAYDVAGMRTSAQGEVRRALELEPNNKHAKELQKALK